MNIGATQHRRFQPLKDKNWEQAGTLMKSAGVPSEDHDLLRENLASYLAYRIGDSTSRRWQAKVERDLRDPYTDAEVFDRIDTLQSALKTRIEESGGHPNKLYLIGSFAKGRFSPHEALDTLNVVPRDEYDEVLSKALVREDQNDVHYFPLREDLSWTNQGMLLVDGVSREVSAEEALQPGFLRKEYERILEEPKTGRREIEPRLEKWLGKAHRSRYDNHSLHSRAMRLAVAGLGAASGFPVLGPLVKSAWNCLVVQNHQADRLRGKSAPR